MKPMASNGSMASQFFPPNFLLQMQQPFPQHQQQLQDPHEHHHLLPPAPHPAHLNPFLQDFNAMAPPPKLVGSKRPPPSIYLDGDEDGGAASDEDEDSGSALENPKKRRLSVEQVRTLEKNFEVGNKLEPERKLQLARVLGLQPRQVAIWFQNRRARWKTKQLEKDYDALRRQFDAARAENDALQAHNNKLQAEIVTLKGGGGGSRQEAASELINLNVKETEASCSENSSEINLDISRPAVAPPPAESPTTTMHRAGGGGAIQFYASLGRPGLDIDQLLHSHSSSPPLKMELGTGNAAPANFGSLLCGAIDEPPQFWPWAADGHHQFN